jgi:hypothetical protein
MNGVPQLDRHGDPPQPKSDAVQEAPFESGRAGAGETIGQVRVHLRQLLLGQDMVQIVIESA